MERIFSLLTENDVMLPVYVTGVGFEEYQDHVTRKEGFPNYHLAICENGEGKLLIDHKEYIIEKGMAFIFHPNIPHEYYPIKEPWSIRWIIFLGNGVEPLLKAINFGMFEVFKIKNLDEVNYVYNRLYKILSSKKASNMLEASGILYSFLTSMINLIEPEVSENSIPMSAKLDTIIEYIKDNYQNEISLDELADLAGISPSYLCRLFKQVYKMSPFTYILRSRINAAKEMLLNYPDRNIKNIALESGFHNVSYFGSVFRKMEKYSPKQFRQLYSIE